MSCNRTQCYHAISDVSGRVVGCGFYPLLRDLPDDCQVPEIEEQPMGAIEEIIELTEEMLIK
jgi:hypothetical protein